MRSVRDEDSAVYRSCAFLGDFAALALGSHSGEIRIHDTLSGDLIDTLDAHDTPAYQLRVRPHIPCPLVYQAALFASTLLPHSSAAILCPAADPPASLVCAMDTRC